MLYLPTQIEKHDLNPNNYKTIPHLMPWPESLNFYKQIFESLNNM
jgi:hypothetical protein